VDVASAAGLFFAAVAAGGSAATVWLTIGYRREERIRRVAEALVRVRRTAVEVIKVATAGHVPRSEVDDAVAELGRVMALPLRGVKRDARVEIEYLLADEAWRDPQGAAMAARRAQETLAFKPTPGPWHRRVISGGGRWRARG
jgi:predicted type IV restriction endonuclease